MGRVIHMTNETTNAPENGNPTAGQDEHLQELINAVHHNGLVALRMRFADVEGEVMKHDVYGPIFVYRVKDEAGDGYACGFFLRELVALFQGKNDPAAWMASFYVELMKKS